MFVLKAVVRVLVGVGHALLIAMEHHIMVVCVLKAVSEDQVFAILILVLCIVVLFIVDIVEH
jgi:hypothetical protein